MPAKKQFSSADGGICEADRSLIQMICKQDLLVSVPEGQQAHGVFAVRHREAITFICGLWAFVLAFSNAAGKRSKCPVWILEAENAKYFRYSLSDI